MRALREWATACQALGQGETILVVRKGGIHEPSFRVPADGERFVLLPGRAHERPELLVESWRGLTPDYRLRFGARVAGHWTIDHPAALEALQGLHIWSSDYAEQRLRWRPTQSLAVVALRVHTLRAPISAPIVPGCRSWVELRVDTVEGPAVLSDAAFEDHLGAISSVLERQIAA
ncbi:MAG: hypothetical protein ACI9WU_003221 [Myxococcota bacterium]|jgi:hypothetical protein